MGGPLGGALVMPFWLGTLPSGPLGVGVQALSGAVARRMPLGSADAIVLGVFTLVWRRAARWMLSPGSIPAADTVQQVQALGDTTPSCCRHHDN